MTRGIPVLCCWIHLGTIYKGGVSPPMLKISRADARIHRSDHCTLPLHHR